MSDADNGSVTTYTRAVALRAAVVFGPIGVLAIVVAVGRGPWAPFLLFFGAFGVITLVLFTTGDRKLKVDLGRPDAPWSGNYAASRELDTLHTPHDAIGLARQAVLRLSPRNVVTVGDHSVIGWVGSVWTNVARWQAYEVAVVAIAQANGTTKLVCCARPRFSFAYFGGAMSQRLAAELHDAVVRLI